MSQHLPNLSTTRRTLLRTTAWSVPAVSLVAVAPAFAGSGEAGDGVPTGFLRVVWGPTEAEQEMFGEWLAALPYVIHSHQLVTVFEVANLAANIDETITVHGVVKPPMSWGATDYEHIAVVEDGFLPVPPNGTLSEGGELPFVTPEPLPNWRTPASVTVWTPPSSVVAGDASQWEFKVMPPMNAPWASSTPMSFTDVFGPQGGE